MCPVRDDGWVCACESAGSSVWTLRAGGGRSDEPAPPLVDPASPWKSGRFANRIRARHATVHAMLEAGHSRRSIGRQLHMAHRTIKSLADAARPEDLFTGQYQFNRASAPDECKPYIDNRWNEGCTSAWKLREEIVPLAGGFTTKLHLSADGRCRPLSLIVTAGQRADCTQFEPVLEKIRLPRIGPGRPRKKPDTLAADKAYSNGPCRTCLRRRRIRHTIPEKADSQAARLRRGSRGGRPPAFGEQRYKKRNNVERAINKLKHSGAVATRYDKRGYIYLGTATAAALVIWLRT